MSHDELKMARRKAVGTKQTIKALERGEAKTVYLAKDADEKITRSVLELCEASGVEIVYVDTMAQLGDIPSYLVKAGDVVGVREKSRELVPFRKALETAGDRTIPEWLSLHEDGLTATIVSLPSREQIDVPVQEHMVVELYSR